MTHTADVVGRRLDRLSDKIEKRFDKLEASLNHAFIGNTEAKLNQLCDEHEITPELGLEALAQLLAVADRLRNAQEAPEVKELSMGTVLKLLLEGMEDESDTLNPNSIFD